jgi:hypothetical protein
VRRRFAIVSALACSLGLAAVFPVSVLRVEEGAGGENLVAMFLLHPGDRWEIGYTHSWYRVPQKEVYRWEPAGGMLLQEMYFGTYPAALYYCENPTPGITRGGGGWRIENLDREVREVRFKVGYTTDCYLMIHGRKIPFLSLAPAGQTLSFAAEKAPYARYVGFRILQCLSAPPAAAP